MRGVSFDKKIKNPSLYSLIMRTANPTLSEKVFTGFARVHGHEAMSIDGTVNKTAILLFLVILPAFWVFTLPLEYAGLFSIGGAIGGLVFALITIFKKEWAMYTAPAYAVLEGLFMGGISAYFESMYPGIVWQAVLITFGILAGLLLVYKSGWIPVTENFRLGVFAATAGIALIYLASFILSFFGIAIPMIHEGGLVGILFSVFVIIVASLNLVLDFDFIEKGAEHGAPKFMEWYAAFGLLITLVWLYVEVLRLLSKMRSSK